MEMLVGALGVVVWALVSGVKDQERRKAFLVELGLTVLLEDPGQVTGTYKGHDLIIDGVRIPGEKGVTINKTRIFVSSACPWTTAPFSEPTADALMPSSQAATCGG